MKVDAFSQRQQFLYFRNSLVKCGQSGERQLGFYERKEVQEKTNDHIFCSGVLIFYKVFIVVQRGIPYLT